MTDRTDSEAWRLRLGSADITPSGPVVAGTVGTWTVRYVVGAHGVDDGGTIKIGQRGASDWEDAQFSNPTGPGYTTVSTTGPARLQPRFSHKGHIRPWFWSIVIDVNGAALAPGDVVEIVLGETREGSPGIRAQTFRETTHRFGVFVDPTNSNSVEEIAEKLALEVVTATPITLWSVTPADTVVGKAVEVVAHLHDSWGNHCGEASGVSVCWIGHGSPEIESENTFVFTTAGAGFFEISATVGGATLRTTTNPLRIHASQPALRKLWGDLHAQTGETVGAGTEDEYFEFARDCARLDFASHQANDFQVSDAYWSAINDATRRFNEPGRFVTFPGYEWSGNTSVGGDRNVIFLEEGHPIFRANDWLLASAERRRVPLAHNAPELFQCLREAVPLEKVILGAHCGGRYANISHSFDPELGPLVEVVSCWGVFEWLVKDALEAGHRIAIMANSDGHHGRPGFEKPGVGEFGIPGGLTCVLAEEHTRQSIFSALKARRCYATTGARIDLTVSLGEHQMGSAVFLDGDAVIRVSVHGTAPIDSVTFIEGVRTLAVARPPEFEVKDSSTIRISWKGARARGRATRLVWDGSLGFTGATIAHVSEFGFDASVNGITTVSDNEVRFTSYTSGDMDGLVVRLRDIVPSARLLFTTAQGELSCTLAEIPTVGTQYVRAVNGLDAEVCFERYPDTVDTRVLDVQFPVAPSSKEKAFRVKVIQTDGQMAWSSPMYVNQKTSG